MRGVRVCLIDYVEKSLEADRRYRKGERQRYCTACKLYHWPEEVQEGCTVLGVNVCPGCQKRKLAKDMALCKKCEAES